MARRKEVQRRVLRRQKERLRGVQMARWSKIQRSLVKWETTRQRNLLQLKWTRKRSSSLFKTLQRHLLWCMGTRANGKMEREPNGLGLQKGTCLRTETPRIKSINLVQFVDLWDDLGLFHFGSLLSHKCQEEFQAFKSLSITFVTQTPSFVCFQLNQVLDFIVARRIRPFCFGFGDWENINRS